MIPEKHSTSKNIRQSAAEILDLFTERLHAEEEIRLALASDSSSIKNFSMSRKWSVGDPAVSVHFSKARDLMTRRFNVFDSAPKAEIRRLDSRKRIDSGFHDLTRGFMRKSPACKIVKAKDKLCEPMELSKLAQLEELTAISEVYQRALSSAESIKGLAESIQEQRQDSFDSKNYEAYLPKQCYGSKRQASIGNSDYEALSCHKGVPGASEYAPKKRSKAKASIVGVARMSAAIFREQDYVRNQQSLKIKQLQRLVGKELPSSYDAGDNLKKMKTMRDDLYSLAMLVAQKKETGVAQIGYFNKKNAPDRTEMAHSSAKSLSSLHSSFDQKISSLETKVTRYFHRCEAFHRTSGCLYELEHRYFRMLRWAIKNKNNAIHFLETDFEKYRALKLELKLLEQGQQKCFAKFFAIARSLGFHFTSAEEKSTFTCANKFSLFFGRIQQHVERVICDQTRASEYLKTYRVQAMEIYTSAPPINMTGYTGELCDSEEPLIRAPKVFPQVFDAFDQGDQEKNVFESCDEDVIAKPISPSIGPAEPTDLCTHQDSEPEVLHGKGVEQESHVMSSGKKFWELSSTDNKCSIFEGVSI